ncbi:PAS domain S-box protein [Faunimonas sp. B44]|uniref:PAS domain S-box protein n=1 Tax=Faunimonas sp. B44 TaxID=3461493 RepID=UPI0040440138
MEQSQNGMPTVTATGAAAAPVPPRAIRMLRDGTALLLITIALLVAALGIDSLLPPEYATGLLYLGIMMLSFWLPWRYAIVALAALAVAFVGIGYVISPDSAAWGAVETITNRSVAAVAIVLTAFIADRHRASIRALRRSEATLREAQSLTHLGHFERRVGSPGIACSAECLRIFGLGAEARTVPERELLASIHPDDRDRFARHLMESGGTEEPVEADFRVVCPDGEVRDVVCAIRSSAEGGVRQRLVGTVLDVTERRRTESALAEREARLRSILDTVPEALITIDEFGIIEDFSKSSEALFGYQAEEVIGKNVMMLMPAPYREEHDGYMERYRRTGERRIIGIGRIVTGQRKGGTTFPMELAVGEANASGRRLFTGFVRDLTSKQKMEQELRQAQKMEAVGQLTGGIAHDFNNLLTVIIGNLEMLEARLEGTEAQRALLAEAMETAQLGAQLTERLLAFGRRQPLVPRVVDVGQMIRDLSGLFRRTLGETIQIQTRIADHLPRTQVDPSQLQNALLNLAINARDAMPTGGTLTFEVAPAELDLDYARSHSEVRPGRYVAVTITDTGAGMSREVQERAFEPFFTTKPVGSGTGLGLSMVYGFVKQSGGHVQLYSEAGHGTSVRIYLPPASEGDQVLEAQPRPVASAYPGRGETVLVVEDEVRLRRVTVARLNELGYAVIEAENGPAAVRLMEQDPKIDIVFTDMVMPGGLSGTDVAREARRIIPDVPILLTTGYAEPESLRNAAIDGADWLRKPYTAGELARKMREMLEP